MIKKTFSYPALMILYLLISWPALSAGSADASYHLNSNRLFWFLAISDIHVGDVETQDTEYLTWAVNDAATVIDPLFIVGTGDLTDSTNGGTIPNGPYLQEWQAYRAILDAAGMDETFYYDLPGNHDHYNDADFVYYLTYSIQGSANGTTQHSWTRPFPFGTYHFLGISTPGNDGAPFSIWPWDDFGDHAGLDAAELAYIESELQAHAGAEMTFIFGHHPFEAGYASWLDTGLTYGLGTFLSHIDTYGVPLYSFGHTHQYLESIYDDSLSRSIFYMNLSSLGEEDADHFAVFAVDGNGLSQIPGQKGVWPVVLITAPMDRCLGSCTNPYAYDIPQARYSPIRALVFSDAENPVTSVEYRIDESGDWTVMQQVGETPVWTGVWDASAALLGSHIIEVRAQSGIVVTDRVETVVVEEAPVQLVVDFGADGLRQYDDGAWSVLYGGDTQGLERYEDRLVVNSGITGLYLYDGAWENISPYSAEQMVSTGDTLYADLGAQGLQRYKNDAWTVLTGIDVDDLWVSGDTLFVGLDGFGLYRFDGSVTKLRSSNAQDLVFDGGVIYADFGGDGLWKHEDEAWTQLTGINVHDIWMSDHRLIAGLDGVGLYAYDGSVSKIRSENAESVVTDRGILYADFGAGGLWRYVDRVWTMIDARDAETLWVRDQKLIADFGGGGLSQYDGAWTLLLEEDAQEAISYP